MGNFLANLFDTSDFPARWSCGLWTSGHGWLHILSDFATFGAYTAIPIAIGAFVLRHRDVPFYGIFWMFGAFIFFCGSVHLMEGLMFWWPAYRMSGILKLGTAIVSWATVVAVVRVMPEAMQLPGLRKVNQDLSRANRELEEFASVVSHDLKAPLRGINSLAEWLVEDNPDLPEDSKKNVELMRGRVRYMENLINGILRCARIKGHAVDLEEIDANALVNEVIASIGSPQDVSVEIDGRLPRVIYDEVLLEQVFQNLLSNALKSSRGQESPVIVRCEEGRHDWVFSITDHGRGIPPEHLDRIFKLFQSLEGRQENEVAGVGLSICKRIVETFGGRIWVESEVGKGSTFFFSAPKQPVVQEEASTQSWARELSNEVKHTTG